MGRDYLNQHLALLLLFAENKIYVPEECSCKKTVIKGKQEALKKLMELRDKGDDIRDRHLEVRAKEWEKSEEGNKQSLSGKSKQRNKKPKLTRN